MKRILYKDYTRELDGVPVIECLSYCQDHRKWTLFLFILFFIFTFSTFRTLGLGLEVIGHISHL